MESSATTDTPQPAMRSPAHSPARGRIQGPLALVYSPHAGSAHGHDPRRLLEDAGVEVALVSPVSALDTTEELGWRWRAAGCVGVVAAGGDGCVGAVATHAITVGLPMGILPLGTANDIARALDIPQEPAAAARVIARGATRPLDIGQASPATTQPRALTAGAPAAASAMDSMGDPEASGVRGRARTNAYFLHALTLGLNVEFARLATDVARRRQWGHLTYAVSALESLNHFHPISLTMRLRGVPGEAEESERVYSYEAALLAVVNMPVFGGWLNLRLPGVRMDDHLLDFIVVEARDLATARQSIEETLMDALTVMAQRIEALHPPGAGETTTQDAGASPLEPAGLAPALRPHVESLSALAARRSHWLRARSATIETATPVDMTLDGELRARTPVVAQVGPQPISVFAPHHHGITPDEGEGHQPARSDANSGMILRIPGAPD